MVYVCAPEHVDAGRNERGANRRNSETCSVTIYNMGASTTLYKTRETIPQSCPERYKEVEFFSQFAASNRPLPRPRCG